MYSYELPLTEKHKKMGIIFEGRNVLLFCKRCKRIKIITGTVMTLDEALEKEKMGMR